MLSSVIIDYCVSLSIMFINISIVIFLYCWWSVRTRFDKSKKIINITNTIPNKFMMLMLMYSYILQIFFFTLIYSLLICVLLLLIKYTLLEQIATIADGQYPYSTEKIIKKILSFMVDYNELRFYLVSFSCLCLAMFLMIYFIIPKESQNQMLHRQIFYLFDFILLFIVSWFCVWSLMKAQNNTDILLVAIFMIIVIVIFSILYALNKPRDTSSSSKI